MFFLMVHTQSCQETPTAGCTRKKMSSIYRHNKGNKEIKFSFGAILIYQAVSIDL